MIRSMTGYGNSTKEFPKYIVKVEFKSLNSKFYDIKLRLPNRFSQKEIELTKYLEKYIVRGKIDINVSVKFVDTSEIKKTINSQLLKSYYDEIELFADDLKIDKSNILEVLLNLPDAFSQPIDSEEIDENDWKEISEVIMDGYHQFDMFRQNEGENLGKEVMGYIDLINKYLLEVNKNKDQRIENIKERIKTKLDELESDNVDYDRFEQELIYYLEKLDITEEIDRLKNHLKYFKENIYEDFNGRKLGFISQEIGREINTIGSKANDSNIQHIVVMMKDELEKIKQQLSNIL